jgi:hypothetical protein
VSAEAILIFKSGITAFWRASLLWGEPVSTRCWPFVVGGGEAQLPRLGHSSAFLQRLGKLEIPSTPRASGLTGCERRLCSLRGCRFTRSTWLPAGRVCTRLSACPKFSCRRPATLLTHGRGFWGQ